MTKRIMLSVVAFVATVGVCAACVPLKQEAPAPYTADPNCPVGVQHFQEQRPDVILVAADCGDYGTGFRGFYNAPNDSILVNAHWANSVEYYRSVAAHEYGHPWQIKRLDDVQRARYVEIRHLSGAFFDGCGSGGRSPCEDYADVFAMLVGHATIVAYGTAYPPKDQVDAICGEHLMPC